VALSQAISSDSASEDGSQFNEEPEHDTREQTGDDWEDELDEMINNSKTPRSWSELRAKVIDTLRKQHKILGVNQINQLVILRNFATLIMRGYGRIEASQQIALQWRDGAASHFARRVRALARHYQVFETLPREHRGGAQAGTTEGLSLLLHEGVEARTRAWLTAQPSGSVTPTSLARALESEILPDLQITTLRPMKPHTARRWLIRLGWRRTLVRKGVYKDGHNREDVVEYRQDVFLPKMEALEQLMTKFEGPDLVRSDPELLPGQKRIIACFHDECSFHAHDAVSTAWLRPGEQPLRKKGRGRIIHVSDFICEETGRLVVRDADGTITHDARKIIFPGSNGDAWWDTAQLMTQMKDAIDIFETANPDCQALFIFDQSSAHASLPPDALRAFEMNKTNGGKQRKQKDTVIPQSNPHARFRGKAQKMTVKGEAKGLEQVLKERGFDTKRFKRAKCAPVCPYESQGCCMARTLSQQDDFKNQTSMLEDLITSRGHLCMFLPKFHCELNPIEMVSLRK
jgi:hypothetical protein